MAGSLIMGGNVVLSDLWSGGTFILSIPPMSAISLELTVELLWSLVSAIVGMVSVTIAFGLDDLYNRPRAGTAGDLIVLFLCACWMAFVTTILLLAMLLGSP